MSHPIPASALALGLLVACQPEVITPTYTTGEIGTVVTARWHAESLLDAAFTYETASGPLLAPVHREATSDGFDYTATLLGLRSDTAYTAALIMEDEDGVIVEQAEAFESGPLSLALPAIDATEPRSTPSGGFILTSLAIDPSVTVILDEEGGYVWAHEEETADVMVAQTIADPRGGGIYYGVFDPARGKDGPLRAQQIVRVALDGSSTEVIDAPLFHHDFAVHDDGTVGYITYDYRTADGVEIAGDQIVERYPDGTYATVWTAWDSLSYSPTFAEQGPGWTHANALNYDPGEDAYYISLHNYDAILKIDRASGTVRWILGGLLSDFELIDLTLNRQHQFDILDDGLLIFNNGVIDDENAEVVEVRLDEEAMTATAVWRYDADVTSAILGDAQRLDSGSTVVTFSTAGVIDEVTTDGERLWRLESGFGTLFGFSTHLSDIQTLAPLSP
ncbi:MAG: hypothetical protein ACI8S6_000044 [Myxococcota bacterium]|jgi:hypothetical protein